MEKENASLWPPPKISLKHDWVKHLGSEVAHRPEGQVVQQSQSSQSNQLNPSPDHDDKTEQPVVGGDPRTAPGARKTSRSQEIETRSFHEEAVKHDFTETPVVGRDASHEPGNEQSMLNEVNIGFRILGLLHSVVKEVQNSRVRELVKKIENHPHRHALQLDVQNKAHNPFSTTTKQMIQDVSNVEMFELFETDPKTQRKECISYWNEGIVYCTCGHLLKEIVANRGFIEFSLDFLSIPDYVIKKGRPRGHRYGKTPEKKEYHLV